MTQSRFAAALALHKQGRLAEAEPLYREAAAAGDAEAAMNLAVLCLQAGRGPEALAWAQQAQAVDDRSAVVQSTLATALHANGQPEQAVAAYDRALELDPGNAEAQYGLACALRTLDRTEEALACCRRALVIDPDYVEAELTLAEILSSLGRHDEALAAWRRAAEIDPDFDQPRLGLARALLAAGRVEEAEAEYRSLLAASPRHREASAGLATVLALLGRPEEALALPADPDDAEAHRTHARILAELGRTEAAAHSLERAIALAPKPAYFRELAHLRPMRADDPHLAAMRVAATSIKRLPKPDQVQLHFALGRALSDAGEPEAGFGHLLAGNALHRATIRYDEAETLRLFDRIRECFTPTLLRDKAGAGDASAAPVFIVGLPGSGAGLVAQWLAAHPLVAGARESPAFGDALAALAGEAGSSAYPELVESLAPAELSGLGRDYLARMPGRLIDTMLPNALFAGLIHLALPGARIICVERDPVAACLACFAELSTPDRPFAHDLGELGRFHRAHAGLMEHWDAVLPSGTMLNVHYDELLAHPGSAVRRILAFCGLGWDDRVLAPVSRTPSERPPWRPDANALRPLLDELGGH